MKIICFSLTIIFFINTEIYSQNHEFFITPLSGERIENYFLNHEEIGQFFNQMYFSENEENLEFMRKYADWLLFFLNEIENKCELDNENANLDDIREISQNIFLFVNVPIDVINYFASVGNDYKSYMKMFILSFLLTLEIDLNNFLLKYGDNYMENPELEGENILDVEKIKKMVNFGKKLFEIEEINLTTDYLRKKYNIK